MKGFPASEQVTLNAGPLLLLANVTEQIKPRVVDCPAKGIEYHVSIIEPDFVMPVHACMVHPFLSF